MSQTLYETTPMTETRITPEQFLKSFLKVTLVMQLYAETSAFSKKCMVEFVHALEALTKTGQETAIRVHDGRLFYQGEKVQTGTGNRKIVKKTIEFLAERKLSGLKFSPALAVTNQNQLPSSCRILYQCKRKSDPPGWAQEQLSSSGVLWLQLDTSDFLDANPMEIPESAEQHTSAEGNSLRVDEAKNAYAHTLEALKEISQRVSLGNPSGIRKVLRTVQNMIDLIMEDDFVLLGLSTLKDYDDYTYVHSVNVAILSISLGARIGLKKEALEALGISGIFHDLGKIKIPLEIINKPGHLTDQEYNEVKKHSLDSVRMLLLLGASRNILQEILIAPFEHHQKYDLSGYPKFPGKTSLGLYGRIISIADVYDALTSPRIYRTDSISPPQALDIMMRKSGKDFDPVLLKVFINMLGVYPIGSLLKLNTGEYGLVVKTGHNSDPLRPRVLILEKTSDKQWKKRSLVNLTELSRSTGSYKRDVVGSYHPGLAGIQPSEYIL
jgi:HD-GYP domain-containing protein (c-di-GMP phosphodiesterase class II)